MQSNKYLSFLDHQDDFVNSRDQYHIQVGFLALIQIINVGVTFIYQNNKLEFEHILCISYDLHTNF